MNTVKSKSGGRYVVLSVFGSYGLDVLQFVFGLLVSALAMMLQFFFHPFLDDRYAPSSL